MQEYSIDLPVVCLTNYHYISSADPSTNFYVYGDHVAGSQYPVGHFESFYYHGWFLVMENDVVRAGPPHNGNNEFEAILYTVIHNVYRHGSCFIAFDNYGIPESHCNDNFRDRATAISVILNF